MATWCPSMYQSFNNSVGSGCRFGGSMTHNCEESPRPMLCEACENQVEVLTKNILIHQATWVIFALQAAKLNRDKHPLRASWGENIFQRWGSYHAQTHMKLRSSLFHLLDAFLLLSKLSFPGTTKPRTFQENWVAEWWQIMCQYAQHSIWLIGQHRLFSFWPNLLPIHSVQLQQLSLIPSTQVFYPGCWKH